MNKEQSQAFKLQLLGMRMDLTAQLSNLRGGAASRAEASAEHFSGVEDSRAQLVSARDLEFALDEHETIALSQIDAALKRLDGGVYGDCMDCGVAIPLARLKATPQALRCVGCQEKHERGGDSSVF